MDANDHIEAVKNIMRRYQVPEYWITEAESRCLAIAQTVAPVAQEVATIASDFAQVSEDIESVQQ